MLIRICRRAGARARARTVGRCQSPSGSKEFTVYGDFILSPVRVHQKKHVCVRVRAHGGDTGGEEEGSLGVKATFYISFFFVCFF